MKSGMIALLVLSCFAAMPASAQVFPPTVTKTFTPSSVQVNALTTLTITLTNPNNVPLTGASLSDVYPAALVNTGTLPHTLPTTCPSGTAFATFTGLSFGGGTIPANGSCTITAQVFSATPGVYQNLTGSLFSSGPSSLGGAFANLTVTSPIPTLSTWGLLLLAAIVAAVALMRL